MRREPFATRRALCLSVCQSGRLDLNQRPPAPEAVGRRVMAIACCRLMSHSQRRNAIAVDQLF